MTTSTGKTAYGYVRLSKVDAEPGKTLAETAAAQIATQKRAVQGWADAHAVTIVEWFQDLDLSGKLDSRPELDRLRANATSVDYVVAGKLDRWHRNLIAFRAFSDEMAAAGTAVVAVAESIDLSSSTGRLIASILALFAEWELETITKRVNDGLDTARANNVHLGPVPFGFRKDAAKRLEVDPELVGTVNAIVNDYLNGVSQRELSKRLGWHPTSLRNWMQRPALRQIIGAATFAELQARIASAKTDKPTGKVALLSGLLVCGSCGRPMTASVAPNGVRRMRCTNSRHDCQAPASVNAEAMEHLLESAYLDGWGGMRETVMRRASDLTAERVAVLRGQVDDLRATLATLDTDGMISTAADIKQLEDEIAALEQEARGQTMILTETGRTRGQAWEQADVQARRDILARWIEGGKLVIAPSYGKQPPASQRLANPMQVQPGWADETTSADDVRTWLASHDTPCAAPRGRHKAGSI